MGSEADDETTAVVDARKIDGEPFGHIMAALQDLDSDGSLLLINSFEPEPLYSVLDQRGFTHETERIAEDEWHVQIESGE